MVSIVLAKVMELTTSRYWVVSEASTSPESVIVNWLLESRQVLASAVEGVLISQTSTVEEKLRALLVGESIISRIRVNPDFRSIKVLK